MSEPPERYVPGILRVSAESEAVRFGLHVNMQD